MIDAAPRRPGSSPGVGAANTESPTTPTTGSLPRSRHSLERGVRVARRLHAGLVHINDQTIADYAEIPFGGMGASGNGSRFGSMNNWEEFTQWHWLTIGGKPTRYPF